MKLKKSGRTEMDRTMSTCRWCTPGGSVSAELLKSYAAKGLPEEDFIGANDDLSYCMECVVEYHKARDEVPQLHKTLWPLETSRLIVQLEKAMREEIEEDDELFLIEDDEEKQLFGYGSCSFESNVRVPLLEILRFPYLLLNKRISELSVEALCKMEQVNNTFQVYEKLPGVYLLLVHPNEMIRRWAILTAKAQGKVDRDDYYDLEEVFTCLFKVIELGLFENSDIYMCSEVEDGKLILLPSHLYDTSNYKNYWLGICMLLTVLEEQAMASLLLGPNKQNDFMQSILHIMEKQTEDESTNPFWPALHCFMTILDRLGSKVWGQLIDPIQAFQTIIASPSYNSEIENIRKSCQRKTKCEPDSDDDDDDLVTCSQAVYNFNTEKVKKETGWKSAICPDYCPNMYEDLQSLANILQSDIGQDIRVHNSTFLWFIPYVQSVMDLKDLGVAYISEVIHHLSSEIKVVFTQGSNRCDKVTEFFVRVLVSIIELHRSKKCLYFLWISSHKWVEAIVKCALLPICSPRITSTTALSNSPNSQTPSSVQYACMQLIRSLLREGFQLGQQTACKQYLDKFNLIIRGNVIRNLDLSKSEVQGLQTCLTQIIKVIKDKASSVPSSPVDANLAHAVPFIKTERMDDECYGSGNSSPYSLPEVPVYPLEGREGLKTDIKKEPPEKRRNKARPSSSPPGCGSPKKKQIKQEKLDASTFVSDQVEPKKILKGWQSKLSEVMAKVPNFKPHLTSIVSESNISSGEGSSKPEQNPCYVTTEEQEDFLLKVKSDGKESESDSSDGAENIPLTENVKKHLYKSEQNVSDNLPVSEQLQRLSLDHDPLSRPIKKEFQGVGGVSSSSFLESNMDCLMDSETDDDDTVPLSLVKKKLLMKSSKRSAVEDMKMNRNSDHTAGVAQTKGSDFLDDSIQNSYIPDVSSIKRKVKGTTRALGDENVSFKTELSDGIITISSDSDQEEEPLYKSVKIEKQESGPDTSGSPIQRTEKVQSEPVDLSFDEHGSQMFEFETQDDIYSAWSDSQYEEEKKPDVQQDIASRRETGNIENNDQDHYLNQWGYDTDYVSDEIIEKAAEDAEQQFKALTSTTNIKSERKHSDNKSPHEAGNSSVFIGKRTHELANDLDHRSKQTKLTKEPLSLHAKDKKTDALSTQKKAPAAKTNRSKSPLKAQKHIRKNGSPGKASLAVVPPKKIHKGPEPTSTVEKLRLKKAPRKAFDLSQRSLDSLAELRNHGKSAGFVETKKTKSKLISPQSLAVQRNKKLLACQERQFFRQSRPKDSEKRRLSSSPKDHSKNTGVPTKESGNSPRDQTSLPSPLLRAERMERPQKQEPKGRGSVDGNKLYASSSESYKDPETGGHSVVKLGTPPYSPGEDNVRSTVPVTAANSNDHNEEEEEDDLFLTQADPLDMDLCSQLETEINVGEPDDLCTSSVADQSPSAHQVTEESKCSPKDCTESVRVSSNNSHITSAPEKKDDHVFARPGLPPSLQKPVRPPTTKVYSSGTASRTASFTKDLESLPKHPPNVKPKTQSSKPPVPRPPIQLPGQSRASMSLSTNNVLKPLINQNNIPLQGRSSFIRGSGIQTPHRDQNWLVREVLNWGVEKFDNLYQFGSPNEVCQLPLLNVPVRFSGYDQYFNVFCPLMLLNAFESLAQEWAVKRLALSSHLCKLHLQNFCNEAQMNRGEFQAWIRNVDLNMQWLPKEGDLVFLLVPECTGSSPREESDLQEPPIYHTGHMSRFVRTQYTRTWEKEQYTLCELSIHTYGNLSPYRKQQVRCAVIGSLITTQRQFKALVQLQRNPLFKPIINPTPNDFLPRDKLENYDHLLPISKDYNNDQRNAIEKAYAMVTQHPRLPRICMIHGPPGTGKSRTIVGLLHRIFMEKHSNVPDLSVSAKNKRNRVLVCAPSNAALDDLMKKIILGFKEKCRDKNNTLGNCGDINLVRLGSEKTISSDVVKFSLDCQVNYRIKKASQDLSVLKQKEALDRQLDELSRQRAMQRCSKITCEELDQKIAKLTKERQYIANVLKEERRRPQEVQRNIILESHIICCTLSTSGGILLESAFRQLGQEPFGCVIVDEAGQSCEVETLIPLLHRCCKLVLVGDPEQLPPTVISVKAEELGYGQSLMSRLCQILDVSATSSPILQLTKQYRMHPDICLFPSRHFYNSVLKTDRATEEVRCSSDWPFQPYMVFDVSDGFEIKEKESFSNPLEVKMVMALIKLIKSKKKEFGFRNIGIITPYRAQKMKIINELKKTFGDNAMPGEVDTVDGFQGRQKDCIIVTCVRANSIHGCIGFLASRQRLNVTITRAKFSLFILGSLRTLMKNEDWNHLIQDAQRRGALVKTQQKDYQKDVNKILKLKPVIQRTTSYPSTPPVEAHKSGSPYTPPMEASGRGSNNPSVSGGPPYQKIISHPAVDVSRIQNRSWSVPQVSERKASSNAQPPAIPLASSGSLRDPRLARRREETRVNNTLQSGQQQSSDTNRFQGQRSPSSAVTRVKRPSQPPGTHARSGRSGNKDVNQDSNGDTDQEPKKRKVS